MQISKIYSNHKDFKNITFNLNGLNVIYADVKSDLSEKKNSHDLGKTKLTQLIDFMLLKSINKNHFLRKHKDKFISHIFYLEIYLNSGKYLTIKKSIETDTKTSFKVQDQTVEDYIPPTNWDYENEGLESSKRILAEYLSLDFFFNKNYTYRKSLNYSLRTQDDFKDVYKLNKFTGGKDINWKPFMFDLLGFKGELLQLKYNNDSKIEEIKTLINSYKNDYSVNTKDRDEIIAEKSILENEYKEVESQIDKFNFYNQDKQLIKDGIDGIEVKISDLNSISYKLNYEISRLKTSIKNNFSFDIDKVKKVYEETSIYFSDELTSDYRELINFNKKLTTERNKLLKETIKEKEEKLKVINSELEQFNSERKTLLSHLTDSDTFTKFKSYQKHLAKIEGQLAKLQEKIKTIDLIINKENKIEDFKNNIKSTVDELKKISQSTDKNIKYNKIRTLFSKFYKHIMNENAVLSWSLNTNNNVDFIPPKVKSKIDENMDTAKDEGNTYMKLLCVAFDLSILCSYNEESYFRFVYHDDVLSQQDNGIKIRLLELVDEITNKYNIQYILSVIESDLPVSETNEIQKFNENQIVLKLHDKDISGTLFGFEF